LKRAWFIPCAALLALTQFALADDSTATPGSPAPAAVSAPKSLKEAWPSTKDASHRVVAKGVPNFGKLNDFIWRSGQPTREGYQTLEKEGLKTVINLREEFPQDKEMMPQGVKYVFIPIKDQHEPTEEQAKQFLEVASNPENWPLLVHCHGGEGRAGVMSAIVRLSIDGWDQDKTMKEVGNFRIKHLGFISTSMPACQRNFLKSWKETSLVQQTSVATLQETNPSQPK
jgi:protein tyrosine phosphatase (PTP) superfamily phosphohydrolase (DUF442 family)